VTDFERALIDSRAFQRLRLINQLAMVDSVYPGATHTRFLHSLGTLHVCSELVLACNNTVKMLSLHAPPEHPLPVKIGLYTEFLARIVALLHDMAHVPFGHVFEKEARVFKKDEWEDDWRVQQIFGEDSEFARIFCESLVRQLDSAGLSDDRPALEAASRNVLGEVKQILIAKGDAVLDLRYPFVADLVGNTICADLIDYVQRDMYYAGLTEGLATRFLNHLGVVPVQMKVGDDGEAAPMRPTRQDVDQEYALPRYESGGEVTLCRVVLVQYRYTKRQAVQMKDNVLPEAIDLVRRRKQVAEKLYFHHAKLTATSMLSTAAYASGIDSAEPLWNKTDHEVLRDMASQASLPDKASAYSLRRQARAKHLAQRLLDRRFHKPIYRLSYHPNIEDEHGKRLWGPGSGVYSRFYDPKEREEFIDKIELAIEANLGLPPLGAAGAVTISCPDKKMQLKGFEMLVLPYPTAGVVSRLEDTVKPTVKDEIEIIKTQHQELWSLEVLIDSAIVDLTSHVALRLSAAIEEGVGLPNELREFTSSLISLENLTREGEVDRELRTLDLRSEITDVHRKSLIEGIAARGEFSIRDQLRQWGYEFDAE